MDASGLTPKVQWYTPDEWKTSIVLGNNELGTAAVLYDPKYTKDGKTVRAYRIYSENRKLSEHTWSADMPGSSGPTGPVVQPAIPPTQPVCNAKPSGYYQDAHSGAVHVAAKAFCRKDATTVVRSKFMRIGFEEVPTRHPSGSDAADDNYDFKINSVDGCPAPNGYNLKEPVRGTTCEDVMYTAWSHCNNEGRGGSITAGCLTYGIHPRF
ncbi:hypothetical protein MMC17_006968 [Xylographa soralifera]|nr:hypothetical protein [Xylographa soralifera]